MEAVIPDEQYRNRDERLKEKAKYRKMYSRRMQMVEPVFADIAYCKGITRFTLRTQKKVSIQWALYCVVHNIGKYNMAERRKKGA